MLTQYNGGLAHETLFCAVREEDNGSPQNAPGMALEPFEALLAHPAPAFACYACGDGKERKALIAPVTHIANAPADVTVLGRIPDVPGADATRALYRP